MSCQTTCNLHLGRCNFQLIWFWLFQAGVVKLPACFFLRLLEKALILSYIGKQLPGKKAVVEIHGE